MYYRQQLKGSTISNWQKTTFSDMLLNVQVITKGCLKIIFFDYPNQLKSHRVRRDDITTGIAALRNTDGVRRWFRTVEGDLLSETRSGNKEKGFDLTKNVY